MYIAPEDTQTPPVALGQGGFQTQASLQTSVRPQSVNPKTPRRRTVAPQGNVPNLPEGFSASLGDLAALVAVYGE